MPKKILVVVGARPNFIKITQFPRVFKERGLECKLLFTGQHKDRTMSEIFFEQFGLKMDYLLNTSSFETSAGMIGQIILGIEDVVLHKYNCDLILAVGDIDSTLAAGIAANKLKVPLGHIESGLRSGDRDMPEEINRLIVDEISDYYFVTEESGQSNLLAEGKKPESIFFVGNTMIDTLVAFDDKIQDQPVLDKYQLEAKNFILMTMHRPSNVDNVEGLGKLLNVIKEISGSRSIVFPIHPRTLNRIEEFDLMDEFRSIQNLKVIEPLDYFSFQKLICEAMVVVTDSGGIQEETTFRKIPCITLRKNTERPITLKIGSNVLADLEPTEIAGHMDQIIRGESNLGTVPPLWDGEASVRIAKKISGLS